MSLFGRIGDSLGGDDADDDAGQETTDSDEAMDIGPNFLPERQEELYFIAHRNAVDLSDSGVCGECGTTLSPVKADRLYASCKNEDCDRHLGDTEMAAVENYADRHGHPEDVDPDADLAATRKRVADGEGSALEQLDEAMDGD